MQPVLFGSVLVAHRFHCFCCYKCDSISCLYLPMCVFAKIFALHHLDEYLYIIYIGFFQSVKNFDYPLSLCVQCATASSSLSFILPFSNRGALCFNLGLLHRICILYNTLTIISEDFGAWQATFAWVPVWNTNTANNGVCDCVFVCVRFPKHQISDSYLLYWPHGKKMLDKLTLLVVVVIESRWPPAKMNQWDLHRNRIGWFVFYGFACSIVCLSAFSIMQWADIHIFIRFEVSMHLFLLLILSQFLASSSCKYHSFFGILKKTRVDWIS